jgi:precorrin-6B methylase 2
LRVFYSTFIPGFVRPVSEALAESLPGVRILSALDGLVVYETNARAEAVQKLPFVTNSFYVIKSFAPGAAGSIADLARKVVEDRGLSLKLPVPFGPRNTFRVITSVANQLVQLDGGLMQQLERRINERTRLRPNRAKPDFEFWLYLRSEGHGFFAFRLSYHRAYDKSLQKGELRPELANVLCRLSEPAEGELFLDPFCGSGAIPIQRARFPQKGLIIASDGDEQKVFALKARIKELGLAKRVVVRRDDALNLTRYQPGSIHKIVTDPPWGHFVQTSSPIEDFYARMLSEFERLLRPGGLCVVVTGETQALESSLERLSGRLELSGKYNILLSGKKASVYVLSRGPHGHPAA